MTRPITFTVLGRPAPWTSPQRGRGRGCIPTPASERQKAWQERVRLSATAAMRGRAKLDGPVALVLSFVMEGDEQGVTVIVESSTDGALFMHTDKPDLTNLVKATEDALSGIVFGDDKRVVAQMNYKFGGKPCKAAKPRRSRKS